MIGYRQGRLQMPVRYADHTVGPSDAPVTLVEYADFQCPFSFRAHPVVVRLQERFGSDLRFVFRNVPVAEMHRYAVKAAEAAESVEAHQGGSAYWRMHYAIFEHQQDSPDALDRPHLLEYAAEAGADPAQVEADLDAATFQERVKSDFLSGARSGVSGTPTFFVNGVRFDGNCLNHDAFSDALLAALAEKTRVHD